MRYAWTCGSIILGEKKKNKYLTYIRGVDSQQGRNGVQGVKKKKKGTTTKYLSPDSQVGIISR